MLTITPLQRHLDRAESHARATVMSVLAGDLDAARLHALEYQAAEATAATLAIAEEHAAPASRITCIYVHCDGAHADWTDPAAMSAWADEHVATHAHDPRWPATFRIDYASSPGNPGVLYRDVVRVA